VRRREVAGCVLIVAATLIDLQVSFFTDGAFPSVGMLALPGLIMGSALLLGIRAATILTVISIVGTIVAHRLSPALRETGFTSLSITWHSMLVVVMLVALALIGLSLSAFDRVYREMQAKERDLADTIRFAPDGILVIDGMQRVVLANPAAERILGWDHSRILGRIVHEILHEATDGSPLPGLDSLTTGETPTALQIANVDGGTRFIEVTSRRMEGERRQLLLRDVSERTEAERARVQADAERRVMEGHLAHAQRLEAVGQLAGGLSHDFNNILTAVGGAAELLRTEDRPGEKVALLDEILSARDRGAALTHQLLAFARREVVQPRVLDLGVLVQGIERLLTRVAGERHPLRFELTPECRVRADVGQLEQAVVNLVSNARDAMPDGGVCTIALEHARSSDGDALVRLHVIDRGTGMSDAVLARAFEPFFTTKSRGQGTGLGLASVHGTMVQCGGRAAIATTPGGGTRVTLEFPFAAEPMPPEASPVDGIPGATAQFTLLVAEDDDAARNVVQRMLMRAGYRVLVAPDGQQALRMLEDEQCRVDMVVTDVIMPGLSGPQLAARIRDLHPRMPVLFMSGYTADAIEELGELIADRALVAKPFSGQLLTSKIAELLATVN
jgi:PAS domain S-box-containing protein